MITNPLKLATNRISQIIIVIIIAMHLSSCITGGTHGSIKDYEYSVSKYKLQDGVEAVLKESGNIQIDTVVNFSVDVTSGKNDTIYSDRYNDVDNYRKIYISGNSYTFHYYGDKSYWDKSKTSMISIVYAYDSNGNGGSAGDGDFSWYKASLKKKLISEFENEFIKKLDQKLQITHADPRD